MARRLFVVLAAAFLAIAAGVAVFLALWFRAKPPRSSPSPSPLPGNFPPPSDAPVVVLREPWEFYSRDHKPQGMSGPEGRDREGNLYDPSGARIEEGLGSASALARYPLTYAFGHPYWKPGSIGALAGADWSAHLARFGPAQRLSALVKTPPSPSQVLTVEAPSVKGGEYAYAPVILDRPLDVAGIVVRRGGILLVADTALTLRVQFILVESGGLFQAGASSPAGGEFRFRAPLDIVLTHPAEGYLAMGAVASQYGSRVYHPGSTGATYTGLPAESNIFGAKVVGVGFNGNFTLAGAVPPPVAYQGTWSCVDEATGAPWLTPRDLLTWFDPADPASAAEAARHNIETAYPATWTRLSDAFFARGSASIAVADASAVEAWEPGAQIVITAKTPQYSVYPVDPQGLVPVWLDHEAPSQREANQRANETFTARFSGTVAQKDTGVEVARIRRVEGSTLILETPLQFDHDSRHTVLRRTAAASPAALRVSDGLHVGLLSRPIRIRSELTGGGAGGCNRLASAVPASGGPGGGVICNTDEGAREWARLQAGRSRDGDGGPPRGSADEPAIYLACYKDVPAVGVGGDAGNFCNQEPPAPVEEGHWMFGTQGTPSCNAIFGGHQMFRMGASVEQDGVELKYMGTPGNFGLVGRYAVHFHLSGFSPILREYLPGPTAYGAPVPSYGRLATVANSSNWCSLSRWYVMHGSHFCNFKNNVAFVCYGSGFFVEDGTEINNTMEHNLAIYNLLSNYDSYYNPTPLYPKVVSDLCMSAVFWLKNNQNRVLRCVAANAPTPVVGVWNVPQKIGDLRGASTLCVGDEALKLPALGGGADRPGRGVLDSPLFRRRARVRNARLRVPRV